jgi:hypothetical protein
LQVLLSGRKQSEQWHEMLWHCRLTHACAALRLLTALVMTALAGAAAAASAAGGSTAVIVDINVPAHKAPGLERTSSEHADKQHHAIIALRFMLLTGICTAEAHHFTEVRCNMRG